MLREEGGLRCRNTVLNHCRKRLVAQRPGGGTKTECVGLRGLRDGYPVPLEDQDGTLGAGGSSCAVRRLL